MIISLTYTVVVIAVLIYLFSAATLLYMEELVFPHFTYSRYDVFTPVLNTVLLANILKFFIFKK